MQKLGLRPEKKAKDQQRMFKLSKMITKDPRIKSTDNINTIYNRTHKNIRSVRYVSRRKGTVNMTQAAKVNPMRYAEFTTKPREDRLSKQLVYGVKTSVPNVNIPGYAKTHGNQRFNLNKHQWIKNTSKSYVKNEYNYRPKNGKSIPNVIDYTKLLYGYKPARDKWVPRSIIKKSAMIPFIGLKN